MSRVKSRNQKGGAGVVCDFELNDKDKVIGAYLTAVNNANGDQDLEVATKLHDVWSKEYANGTTQGLELGSTLDATIRANFLWAGFLLNPPKEGEKTRTFLQDCLPVDELVRLLVEARTLKLAAPTSSAEKVDEVVASGASGNGGVAKSKDGGGALMGGAKRKVAKKASKKSSKKASKKSSKKASAKMVGGAKKKASAKKASKKTSAKKSSKKASAKKSSKKASAKMVGGAKKKPSKKVASKKVASKKVASKKVASKKRATKKN